jgi:hypothetical protein
MRKMHELIDWDRAATPCDDVNLHSPDQKAPQLPSCTSQHTKTLFLDLIHVCVIIFPDRFVVEVEEDIDLDTPDRNRSFHGRHFEIPLREIMTNFKSYVLVHEQEVIIRIANIRQYSKQHVIMKFNIVKLSSSEKRIAIGVV